MGFIEPPLNLTDLKKLLQSTELDLRPPTGQMSAFLGKRYSSAEIRNTDNYCDETNPLDPIRAYRVEALIGQIVQFNNQSDLSMLLSKFVRDSMPGINWEPLRVALGPLEKYLIIHHSFAAPPDETTGLPMAIEIFGEVTRVDEIDLDKPEGTKWRREYMRSHWIIEPEPNERTRIGNLIECQIKQATYANIRYVGIGIPLYS